jgi:putative oxidoreductase
MNSITLTKAGIIIYALVIATFAVIHFKNAGDMATAVPDYMPGGGKVWIYITGTGMILAAIAFLTGKYNRLAGILLATMLFIFVLTMHLPPILKGTGDKGFYMSHLLKDTGLAAAALIIAGRSR